MKEYDIWYKGTIIGNVKASTERKALNQARKIWGPEVTVELV
jgi:hypothetical protein